MRTWAEVVACFEDTRARKLAERKVEFLSRSFRNCMHNVRLRIKDHGRVGLCRNPKVVGKLGQPIICDEEGTAERCKHFECRNTPESVEKDFEEILRSPARVGESYPKLAVLIWFLQDYSRMCRFERFKSACRDVFRTLWTLVSWRWW